MRWYQHRFYNVKVIELLFGGTRWIPRFLQPLVAMLTTFFFCCILKKERRAVSRNLHQITGKRGLALFWKAYRVFYSFGDLLVSYTYVPRASHAQMLSMLVEREYGAEIIDKYLAAGNGLILWTAHLGNPEIASRLLENHGRTVNVARVVEDNPAERIMRARMVNDRLRVVDLRRGADATIELLQALRRNEIVAIQGDRVYNPRHSVEVPFFSKPAAFPLGPFLLSQVSGAPVLPGFVIRQGWQRYRMLGGEPILPGTFSDPSADQQAALMQAVRFLEAQLSVHYDQWVNFFDFWHPNTHD